MQARFLQATKTRPMPRRFAISRPSRTSRQVNSTLEVAKISLREYRDGIYPQDVQLIKRYIESCELDCDRLASHRNLVA